METLYALAAYEGHDLMRRQFETPQWQHRAAALRARDPWRVRFAQRIRRLRPLAGQSSVRPRQWATENC